MAEQPEPPNLRPRPLPPVQRLSRAVLVAAAGVVTLTLLVVAFVAPPRLPAPPAPAARPPAPAEPGFLQHPPASPPPATAELSEQEYLRRLGERDARLGYGGRRGGAGGAGEAGYPGAPAMPGAMPAETGGEEAAGAGGEAGAGADAGTWASPRTSSPPPPPRDPRRDAFLRALRAPLAPPAGPPPPRRGAGEPWLPAPSAAALGLTAAGFGTAAEAGGTDLGEEAGGAGAGMPEAGEDGDGTGAGTRALSEGPGNTESGTAEPSATHEIAGAGATGPGEPGAGGGLGASRGSPGSSPGNRPAASPPAFLAPGSLAAAKGGAGRLGGPPLEPPAAGSARGAGGTGPAGMAPLGLPHPMLPGAAVAAAAAPGFNASRAPGSPGRRARGPVLAAGTVIPALLLTAINSDLPGPLMAQVSRDVWDFDQRAVVLRRGTRLFGRYENQVAVGQRRLLVAWTRLQLLDGTLIELPGLPGTDAGGAAGLPARVQNHLLRVFGDAALLSLLAAGADLSQPPTRSLVLAPTAGSVASAAVGQQLSEAGAQLLRRDIAVQPTLRLAAGSPLTVFVNADLPLGQLAGNAAAAAATAGGAGERR
jgi:Bacterial conjugation TrbI-like protein